MYFLFSAESFVMRCPHMQYIIPVLQYFNISGIPDATVKHSQSINIHDLIQRIESHPQKEAIQNDLEQHQSFNPFSDESKLAIMAVGNTELCEIINVEPKLQCKICIKHWFSSSIAKLNLSASSRFLR